MLPSSDKLWGNAMKKIIIALTAVAFAAPLAAQVHVDGHVRRDGVYVPPHTRTAPNSTKSDNWSTKGNTNPNTGKAGTRDPY